jgi:hypothetical protein
MMRAVRARLALLAGLVFWLLACSSQTKSTTSSSDSLRNASSALSSSSVNKTDNVTRLPYRQQADYKGIVVRVDSATLGRMFTSGSTTYEDLNLQVRFENHNDKDFDSPLTTAHCANQDFYSNQHTGPIDPSGPLPAKSEAEGAAVISVEQPCEQGWLAWTPRMPITDKTEFRWPYPSA